MKKYLIFTLAVLLLVQTCAAFAAASPEPSDKTIKKEEKIGRKGAAEIEKQIPRVLDPSTEAKLAMITEKLTPYMQRALDYNVRILEMKDPNAFALPGGQTYITTGMLEFLKSEDEIAAILCHEFVHADRAHGIVQAKRNNKLMLLSIAGLIAATQAGSSGAGVAMMANGLQTAMMNSYTIELEKEADERGIDILYKAGYNPAAMLTTMERLRVEKLKRAQYELGIFQTHPEEEERVDAALKYLRDKGIEIKRKDVVQSLKVTVDAASADVRLKVDGSSLIVLPKTDEAQKLFTVLAKRLDEALELELAPYDIKILELDGKKALYIRRDKVLAEDELIQGMPALPEIRDRINDALNKSRRGSPLTDYFQ